MKSKLIMAVFCMLILEAGCGAPKQLLHVSRLQDVNTGNHDMRYDRFGPGATPAVVVTGSDQAVTLKLYDLGSGKEIRSGKDTIPEGTVKWWVYDGLSSGRYQAVLLIDGFNKGAVTFEVVK